MLVDTESTGMITGSDCTNSHLHQTERRRGMTATRRRSEIGLKVAGMSMIYAFFTQTRDSRTIRAQLTFTTLARKLPVTCYSYLFMFYLSRNVHVFCQFLVMICCVVIISKLLISFGSKSA